MGGDHRNWGLEVRPKGYASEGRLQEVGEEGTAGRKVLRVRTTEQRAGKVSRQG